MQRSLLAFSFWLLAFSLLVPPVAAAQPRPPALDPARIGMVVRDPWYDLGNDLSDPTYLDTVAQDRMGALLAAAGVRWVRLEFFVDERVSLVGVDPNLDPQARIFEANLRRYDYFINTVAPRHGFRVLGLLGFGVVINADPRDAAIGLVAPYQAAAHPQYGFGVNRYIITWLERALAIAERYQGRIHAYEILNEQNRLPPVPTDDGQPGFAGSEGIHPTITASLHTKFYRLFHQNGCRNASVPQSWRDGVDVISGGLHPRGSDRYLALGGQAVAPPAGASSWSDSDYITALFESSAFQGYRSGVCTRYPSDGIGHHPYPVEIITTAGLAAVNEEVARMSTRLDSLRARLQLLDSQAGATPFWITEIGYNAAYPGQNAANQTLFLHQTFTTLGVRPDTAVIFWFKYEDFPPASGPNAQQWGLVRIPFSENPACPGGACYARGGEPTLIRGSFFALRELAGLPVYRVTLPLVTTSQ